MPYDLYNLYPIRVAAAADRRGLPFSFQQKKSPMNKRTRPELMAESFKNKAEALRRFSRFVAISRDKGFPMSITVDVGGVQEVIHLTGVTIPDQTLFEYIGNWAAGYAMMCEEWGDNWRQKAMRPEPDSPGQKTGSRPLEKTSPHFAPEGL